MCMPNWKTLSLLAALAFGLVPKAGAVPIAQPTFPYETGGTVGGTDVTFQGVTAPQTAVVPGSFSLGQFVVNPSAPGATLTENGVPFDVTLMFPAQPSSSGVLIHGALNGSVTSGGSSDLFATVTSIAPASPGLDPPPFPLTALMVDSPQALAAPNGANPGGGGALTAHLSLPGPVLVPEPSSLAAFALALGGLALWRRRLGR